jgi:hypothetical protein
MLNFPHVDPEQLRKMRTHLFAAQSDPVWRGTVSTLLQMLIDNDLAHHRASGEGLGPKIDWIPYKPDLATNAGLGHPDWSPQKPEPSVDNSNKIVQDEDNFST